MPPNDITRPSYICIRDFYALSEKITHSVLCAFNSSVANV